MEHSSNSSNLPGVGSSPDRPFPLTEPHSCKDGLMLTVCRKEGGRGVTSVMDLLGNRHWPGIFTGLKNRQPSIGELHDGVALARSLWHETVGFGGVGVPISTRWMI